MNLAMILDMVAEGMADRVLLGDRTAGLTGAAIRERAIAGAAASQRRVSTAWSSSAATGPPSPWRCSPRRWPVSRSCR